jgi:RimJ/RimL family protein N-acetyltransferase
VGARDFASAQLGLTRLISIIHPDNARSRRVAAKVGMRVERMEFNPVVGRAVEIWATGSSAQDRRVCRP